MFNCPNPSLPVGLGQYDPDNIFHFNPLYEWKGYAIEHDPRCTTWYVGEWDSERCSND